MGQHLDFQHSFWGATQVGPCHCIWTIISVGSISCYYYSPLKLSLIFRFEKSINVFKLLTHCSYWLVAEFACNQNIQFGGYYNDL